MKATIEELSEVLDVEVLRLQPDDTLVLRYPGRLSQSVVEQIKAQVESMFPGQKVSVLSEGASFEIIHVDVPSPRLVAEVTAAIRRLDRAQA